MRDVSDPTSLPFVPAPTPEELLRGEVMRALRADGVQPTITRPLICPRSAPMLSSARAESANISKPAHRKVRGLFDSLVPRQQQ